MPSLANYWIATSFKDYLVENKKRLEKKYIVPLDYFHILLIIYLFASIVGMSVRIRYNGFYGAMVSAFEISWLGLGWGKTPWYVASLADIFGAIIGGVFALYVTNTQLRFRNQEPITLYQMYLLIYTTLKYEFYRLVCKKTAFHWN